MICTLNGHWACIPDHSIHTIRWVDIYGNLMGEQECICSVLLGSSLDINIKIGTCGMSEPAYLKYNIWRDYNFIDLIIFHIYLVSSILIHNIRQY